MPYCQEHKRYESPAEFLFNHSVYRQVESSVYAVIAKPKAEKSEVC